MVDGLVRDIMPHCTDPGLDEERTNITHRWQSGVAATQPTCATFVTLWNNPCFCPGSLWRKVIGGSSLTCFSLLLVGTGRLSYSAGQGRILHAGQTILVITGRGLPLFGRLDFS